MCTSSGAQGSIAIEQPVKSGTALCCTIWVAPRTAPRPKTGRGALLSRFYGEGVRMQNKHSKENPTIQAEKSKHKPTEQTADMPVEKTSRIPTEETSHMPAEKTSHVPAVKNSSILTEQASVMQPKENSENKTNNAASPVPEIPVMIQQASIYQTFSRESLSEHFQQFPEKPGSQHSIFQRTNILRRIYSYRYSRAYLHEGYKTRLEASNRLHGTCNYDWLCHWKTWLPFFGRRLLGNC